MARRVTEENFQAIIGPARRPGGASAHEIVAALGGAVPLRTVQYRLKLVVKAGRLVQQGKGPSVRYALPESPPPQALAGEGAGQPVRAGLEKGRGHPFRLRYRAALRTLVGNVVRARMDQKAATAHVTAWASEHIDSAERDRFREVAESELLALHEGIFARYQIMPSEFAAWRGVWEAPR